MGVNFFLKMNPRQIGILNEAWKQLGSFNNFLKKN
jgi:hypothetical protein